MGPSLFQAASLPVDQARHVKLPMHLLVSRQERDKQRPDVVS